MYIKYVICLHTHTLAYNINLKQANGLSRGITSDSGDLPMPLIIAQRIIESLSRTHTHTKIENK